MTLDPSPDTPPDAPGHCTAFIGTRRLAGGMPADVALAVKAAAADARAPILTFDDRTGRVLDFDLRGSDDEIVARLSEPAVTLSPAVPRARGRPKLGVVAREITLLPRHWDWLAAQPGGASPTLRRLIDEARRADGGRTRTKAAREAAYRFLAAMAGDLPGYEEAIRALFAGDDAGFAARMAGWPPDVRAHALALAGSGAS